MDYPHPYTNQIEIDLRRTYPDEQDLEKVEQDIIPLRNVLTAFVQRCPTIGYCQGFSFITARLLAVLEEEEAFWVLTQMIEVLLPIDYYSNLLGVLIDFKVFQHIMRKKLPKLC